jgi:hypothetical protein
MSARAPSKRDIVIAFIRDRQAQYDESTCCYETFCQLLRQLERRDDERAFAHGDLDDLLFSERARRRMEAP